MDRCAEPASLPAVAPDAALLLLPANGLEVLGGRC